MEGKRKAPSTGEGKSATQSREWLTLPQAAVEVQVSVALLRREIHRRKLVAHILGNRYRIHRADLQAWLESQRYSPVLVRERTGRAPVVRRKGTRASSATTAADTQSAPGVQ